MKQLRINPEFVTTKLRTSKPIFEVEPLDVNLSKLQFEMSKRLEREVPEYGDFAPVVEKYDYKGNFYNFSGFRLVCSHIKDSADKKQRSLDFIAIDKNNVKEYVYNVTKGSKAEIMNIIMDNRLFESCKSVLQHLSEL